MTCTPKEARDVLMRCNALTTDFHAMSSGDVDALLMEADRMRYRKPNNAPGSRARMFHAFLTRRALQGDGL